MVNKRFDEISSRYDKQQKKYLVFYRIDTKTILHGAPQLKDLMVKCVIWETLGYTSDFEVFEL